MGVENVAFQINWIESEAAKQSKSDKNANFEIGFRDGFNISATRIFIGSYDF